MSSRATHQIVVDVSPAANTSSAASSFPIELASLFENGADGQGTDSIVRADIVIGLKSSRMVLYCTMAVGNFL